MPYLRRLASWYLERWDAPVAGVRRTLMKRVRRAVIAHEQDPEACREMVESVICELMDAGMVDDRRFAENVVRRGRERGDSTRKLRSKLMSKGVGSDVIRAVLEDQAEDDEISPERIAAIRYARRRRFGPWRRPDAREDAPRRELASMARAGFSFDLARSILDREDVLELEDELPRGW